MRFVMRPRAQFREVQGAESPEFLQCFDNGVQCAPGGPPGVACRACATSARP